MDKNLADNERYVEYGSKMVCPKCGEITTKILEIHTKIEYPGRRIGKRRATILTCPNCRVILGSTIYP